VVIRVETTVLDETLILQVVNTVARTSDSERAEQMGIGLRNVRERLAIQFGDRASFKSGPGDDNQWIAEIRLPLLRNGV
jgi:sensor histidine kinase YesM